MRPFAGAPADLKALTFLNDAPPPREFWARRQAHETTIHMVDALAASLGRLPTADQAAIDQGIASDGVDELLCGFFTRGRCKLYDGREYTLVVAPEDTPRRWVVHVAPGLTVDIVDGGGDERHGGDDGDADARIAGSAAQIYLALWNRGDQPKLAGRSDVLDRWRSTQRVRWS